MLLIGAATLKKTFISFDCGHDEDLRKVLADQSGLPDSPFTITNTSIDESLYEDSRKRLRQQLDRVDLVILICGEYTDSAKGPNEELRITRDLEKEYFLLYGRRGKTCRKPKMAKASDKMYHWTWEHLKSLAAGNRYVGDGTPHPHI